ncbi:MAG: MurR/RpiR family transcriptional regulator [Oscillospiraceae bacterium]|nr:MurR/RpiR family transcriptional regulator [Oscillospiraceae bacterium]
MRDFLSRLQNESVKLSKSQRRLSDYITENYDKAAYMTAAKLAATVGVSESTVVRFADELGFDGYPEFSVYLKEIANRKLTSIQRIALSDERIGNVSILDSVLSSDIDKIKRTIENIDRAAFDAAVDAICSARSIYIIGVRSSSALAMFLGYYLNHICENVRQITAISGVELLEQLIHASEGDVVFAISFPRYSKRIIRAVEYASKKGARIISLTDGMESPLAPMSDVCLCAQSEMVSFADSLTAPFSLLNALIIAIGRKKKDSVSKIYGELESIWEAHEVYDKTNE